jgi:hypothetical protein
MAKSRRYRIKTPTMAFFGSNGQRSTVTVPVDAIVVIDDTREGDRLIDVVWNDKNYLMFTQDLRKRGEPVN